MTYNVIIIGGGPAGLTAAIYTARSGLQPVVFVGGVEGTLMPGGQLMTTSEVENFPGFPDGIDGHKLIERIETQATTFGAILIEKWVTSVSSSDSGFVIRDENGDAYKTKSVIVATGSSAKWLGLPNEDRFKNHGLSACAVCDGPLRCFRDQHLFVVGGGDTALEEALFLTKFAKQVTVIHRRDTLRASNVMKERAFAHENIDFLWNSVVFKYEGDEHLRRIGVQSVLTGEETMYDVGGLFMGIGHTPMTGFLEGTVELENRYLKVHNHVFTSAPGLFGCGDVHDHRYQQAITAAGFGCMAAMEVESYLQK